MPPAAAIVRPAFRCCLLGVLGMSSACRPEASPAIARPVAVIVSCDTAGWIAPCGCSAKQSGGLLRRATFVAEARKTADVLLVDAGGAAGGTSTYDITKLEAILRGEASMHVAAHNIGESEARLGAEALRRLAASTQAPLFSTNVRDVAGGAIGATHRLLPIGGTRFVVLGVLSPKYATAGITIDDPRTAALATLEQLKGQFDAVLILAYLPEDELATFAAQIPEADLVFGGPTGQTIAPRRAGPTLWGAVTNKGKFLAQLKRSTPKAVWEGEIVELGPEIADDPVQVSNLTAFRQHLADIDLPAQETGFGPVYSGSESSGEIAGSESCQDCHAEEWKVWQASGHSHAWSTLIQQNAQADSYCQSCHTTGFGYPGGFVSLARSMDRSSVGCESCHGAALAHVNDPQVKTLYDAREKCIHCHDHENSPTFDADSFWKKIAHGKAAVDGRASGGRESE